MIVYRTRTYNTSCNTITLTYTTITSFLFICMSVWLVTVQGTSTSNAPSLPPEHLIMYLGKETSTLGITGLTFLRIASP